MQGHFYLLKSSLGVLQVVGVICSYLNNSSLQSLVKSETLRGNIHTQFVTENVKITFMVQPTHALLKTLGVTKYFFCCKTSNIGTIGNRATAKGLSTI